MKTTSSPSIRGDGELSPFALPLPVIPAGPRSSRSLEMRRSPATASPSRSVSRVTSSFLPPSPPAKRSPASLIPPFTVVGPLPPGTAAPSFASKSASSVPDSRPTSLPTKGPRGPMSIGGFTRRTRLVGVGVSVGGRGAVWMRRSRFCASASTAAFRAISSGLPERRSFTIRSRCWMATGFAPRVALSMNATLPSSKAAWSMCK